MMKKVFFAAMTVGCLVVSILTTAFAQSDRGMITGTVSDPSSAVLPGVSVTATNTQTGTKYETISTETGNYTIVQLPAGVYELAVELPGFKKYVQQGITVQVAQTLRVDVRLQVGANTEEITVNADATLLRTESSDLSHIIPAQRLNELPILGIGGNATTQGLRIYLSQTKLIPGAYYPDGGLTVRINGAPTNTQSVRIEGFDASNQLIPFSAASLQPSVDAVQETAIQTSNYGAEYGQAGGGLYNITMKSGTNLYHGGGFDYLANEAFNASYPYVNTKPRVRRNDYGFNLGGPVRVPGFNGRDKSFFFFNLEQYREFFITNNQPITVPTTAYRQGDFRQALTGRTLGTDPAGRLIMEGTIYDPATTRAAANGQLIRDPFPSNIIPANRMDRVALAIQKLIPDPASTALTGNLTPSFANDRVTTNWSIKGDEYLSSKAKLSAYFGTNKTGAQYSQQLNGSEGLPTPITSTRGTFTVSYSPRLNFDYTLSPTKLLHLGAGYTQYNFNDNAPVLDYDSVKSLGLIGATVLGDKGGRFPTINGLCNAGTSPQCTGTGGMSNVGPGAGAAQSTSYMIQPAGNTSLAITKDNHTYKFGGEFRNFLFITKGFSNTNGQYTFSGSQTGQPYLPTASVGGGTIGFPYASFLLGLVNNGNIANPSDVQTRKNQWAFYAQDSWKVTRKLTLDYGLRWDYIAPLREQYGRLPTLSPALPNPTAGGAPGAVIFEGSGPGRCNCKFSNNYPYAFGPRLGFAYQVISKTVLRAGVSVVYTPSTGSGVNNNAASQNPFQSPAQGESAMRLQDGIAPGTAQPWPNYFAGLYPLPSNPAGLAGPPVVVDRGAGRPARQIMWSVGLQREIFENFLVEAAYVGNRGAWWPNNTLVNYNALTPEVLAARGLSLNNAADRTLLNSALNSTAAVARGFNRPPYPGFPLSASVAQSLRPFPQFQSGLTALFAPLGRTWYDSLQAKATKRLSHGLDFTYAFTWQKELTMGAEADTTGGGAINDVFNRPKQKQISALSRPLTSVLALNYRLPKFGSNKFISAALRDWTIGTVIQNASGLPILIPYAQNSPSINAYLFRGGPPNSTGTFANRVAGQSLFVKDLNCHCIDPRKDLVLNPAAWANPADGQFGTSAPYYNDYRFQRRPQENIGISRTFRFRERMSLNVRMEFTNILNRTEMPNPATTNFLTSKTTNAATGALTGGFGFINPASISTSPVQPRQGTLVARFSF